MEGNPGFPQKMKLCGARQTPPFLRAEKHTTSPYRRSLREVFFVLPAGVLLKLRPVEACPEKYRDKQDL